LNCSFTLEPFEIQIDIARTGRGLGTFTLHLHDGRRLQVSAGMLMNWGILQIVKADL
jgi:hypothetical protein